VTGPATVDPGYFDRMYAATADPWGLATRWYEARKYALSLALLPEPHYPAAFEPGCSVGVLTRMLAARCGRVLAWDGSAAAVRSARERTAGLGNVQVERRVVPGEWPRGQFDLVVFSELLYYFGGADLDRVLELGEAALRPGGRLLAVHWRHPVPEYPRRGDEVHAALRARPGLQCLVAHSEPDFRAEVYRRGSGPPFSVARAGGLV
jgi:SAM-dependent methyltransferase